MVHRVLNDDAETPPDRLLQAPPVRDFVGAEGAIVAEAQIPTPEK